MKTLLIANVCVLVALGCLGSSPPDRSISASIALERTRFLSTENAQATLTIVNNSPDPVFFSTCSVTLFIHSASGWAERPKCKEISHLVQPIRVDPASRYVKQIGLPGCDVYSEPCTEDVRVKYALVIRNSTEWYTTSLPRYEFVPDPSATFDIPGLTGNLPVFMVPGVARDTVFPDTMALEFTAGPSEAHPPFTRTPALVAELATTLTGAGVMLTSTGFQTDGNAWKARFSVRNASKQGAVIDAALEKVRVQYGQRISAIKHYFVFDALMDARSIFDAALSQSNKQAQELAAIAGAQSVGPYWGNSWPRVFFEVPSDRSFPNLDQALPFDKPTVLNQAAAALTSVVVVTENLYVGTHVAQWHLPASTLHSAAQAFRPPGSWFLPPLEPQAVISADRPELYIIGTASSKAALSRGLAPYFAAVLHARSRTAFLAAALGVQPKNASLFVLYPMSQDADLRTVGLATTFTGGDAKRWQSIEADPEVRANQSYDERQRAMVPIAVPDAATTVTEMASAMANLSSETGSPNCSAVEWRLLRATIRKNWMQAQSDAVNTHRKIRKLLLAAVFPMDCQTAHAFLSSLMIFRTYPVQRNPIAISSGALPTAASAHRTRKTVDGIDITFAKAGAQPASSPASHVDAVITFANNTKRNLNFSYQVLSQNLKLEVVGPSGVRLERRDHIDVDREVRTRTYIAPGEQQDISIRLRDWVNIATPGTYYVKVTLRLIIFDSAGTFVHRDTFVSDPLPIQIADIAK